MKRHWSTRGRAGEVAAAARGVHAASISQLPAGLKILRRLSAQVKAG